MLIPRPHLGPLVLGSKKLLFGDTWGKPYSLESRVSGTDGVSVL